MRAFLCRKRVRHLICLMQQQNNDLFEFSHQIELKNQLFKDKMNKQINYTNNYSNNRPPTQTSTSQSFQHQHQHQQSSIVTSTNTTATVASAMPNGFTSNEQNHQNNKINNLKKKIENQMKSYAKQEDYHEMLKLVKVIYSSYFRNCFIHSKQTET